MARARRSQVKRSSRLGDARFRLGVTQADLAKAVGVSLKTIERLEAGKLRDPGVRLLNNCAMALGLKLEQLIEPRYREWNVFDPKNAAAPPDPEGFLHKTRLTMPLAHEKHLLGED